MIIKKHWEASLDAQYRKLCDKEVSKRVHDMKVDIITSISDDNRWLDHIFGIQEYLSED
jgi:hypothetical protein